MNLNHKLLFNLLFLALVSFVGWSFISFISTHLSYYKTPFDNQKMADLFTHSQFAPNPQDHLLIIRDEDLYAYAGWYYLKTGVLDKVNIEHPPLGKYFIGLSIFLFNNQNVGQIFWSLTFLILLYILAQKYLQNKVLAILVVLLSSQEILFEEQLGKSLLDLPLAVFLLLLFLTQTYYKRISNHALLSGLCLGAIASIKYPLIAAIAWVTLAVYGYFKKEKNRLNKFMVITVTAGLVFLLTYLPFFLKNPTPISFITLQTKALKLWLSNVPEYPKFQVFNVLFFDRWLSWWGNKGYIKTGYWNILWPISTAIFFLELIKIRLKKNLLINLWCLFYLLGTSFKLFFPRYLLLLLPFLYLNLCYNLKSLFLFLYHKS